MRDRREHFSHERRAQPRPALEIALPGERADGDRAPTVRQLVEISAAVDVDERRGARQAEGQHGDEALATRQHLGLVTVSAERIDGLGRARWHHVFERRRLHALLAASMRPRTTDGPRGVRVTRTLKGASASSTALAMAAGGEMAPPSPTPLTPSGLRGDGYSRCTVSMSGSSIAVGMWYS